MLVPSSFFSTVGTELIIDTTRAAFAEGQTWGKDFGWTNDRWLIFIFVNVASAGMLTTYMFDVGTNMYLKGSRDFPAVYLNPKGNGVYFR